VTRCVTIVLAMCVLAAAPAWGHSFPPVRTVVIQIERCELAVMIGYQPASGEATDTFLARVAAQPRSRMLATAKGVLASHALRPLVFAVDGKPLAPTSVRAKIGTDPGGTHPMVVVLVTFAIPSAGTLSVTSHDPHSTRISWTDRASTRVDLERAPAQGRWFAGVASFLLPLAAPGARACVTSVTSSH